MPGQVEDVADLRLQIMIVLHDALRAYGTRNTALDVAFHYSENLADAVLAVIDEEAINRMAQHYVDDTHVRAMEIRNGAVMKLKPAQDMVALWVASAKTMLGTAENYTETEIGLPSVSMDLKLAGEYEMFTLTVQRAQKPTPHDLRRRAEAERDEAWDEIERLKAELFAARANDGEES